MNSRRCFDEFEFWNRGVVGVVACLEQVSGTLHYSTYFIKSYLSPVWNRLKVDETSIFKSVSCGLVACLEQITDTLQLAIHFIKLYLSLVWNRFQNPPPQNPSFSKSHSHILPSVQSTFSAPFLPPILSSRGAIFAACQDAIASNPKPFLM